MFTLTPSTVCGVLIFGSPWTAWSYAIDKISCRFEDVEGGKDVEDGTALFAYLGRRRRKNGEVLGGWVAFNNHPAYARTLALHHCVMVGVEDVAPGGGRVEGRKLIVDGELRRITV